VAANRVNPLGLRAGAFYSPAYVILPGGRDFRPLGGRGVCVEGNRLLEGRNIFAGQTNRAGIDWKAGVGGGGKGRFFTIPGL